MKKLLLFFGLAAFLAACQETLEEKCAREAKAYTAKNCPAKLNENVIMDSMTFERATHTLHYYYRLTGILDKEDAMDTVMASKTLKDGLKNTTSMKVYKENGYNFTYTYRSEKSPDKILFKLKLTKKDY